MHYCNHIMVIWNKNQWTEIRGHVIWCNLQLGHIEICRRTCTKCLLSERTSSKKVNGSERINLFYIFLWHIQKPSLRPKRAIKWNESCTFFFKRCSNCQCLNIFMTPGVFKLIFYYHSLLYIKSFRVIVCRALFWLDF